MKLDEVRDLIRLSSVSHWRRITCWGGGGTSYLYAVETFEVAGGSRIDLDSHSHTATYRDDVSLTIAWGMDAAHGQTRSPEYLKHFPLVESVQSRWVDVFWNGALIDRIELDVLDLFGTVFLPTPHFDFSDDRNEEGVLDIERYYVSRYEWNVARIVHEMSNNSGDFHAASDRSEFDVVDEHDEDYV